MELTRDEWPVLIDTVRSVRGAPDYPAYMCFRSYGVCPAGIITGTSYLLLDLYTACDGYSRIRTPSEYYALPSLYVEACSVIATELAKWEKLSDGKS